MQITERLATLRLSCATLIVLAGFAAPTCLHGQDNAVWNATTFTSSPAFIDASTYPLSADFCSPIHSALAALPPSGGVVDARGIVPTTHGPELYSCKTDPFSGFTTPPISTVLLPASSIGLQVPWHLPSNTRLVGEGAYTIIAACPSTLVGSCTTFSGGSDMIDMGSSALCTTPCTGTSIEHLRLEGSGSSGLTVNGIANSYCGSSCYVNDVTFSDFAGTALIVGSSTVLFAAGSGPYTNFKYGTGVTCGSGGCPVCVSLNVSTLGLHGLTCSGNNTTSGNAAIYVNASNNSLEDIHIEDFWDGIQVASGVSNVTISNVLAAYNNGMGSLVQNVVHICGPNYATTTSSVPCTGAGTSSPVATDVVVLNATDGNDAPSTASADVIQDDVTGETIGITSAPNTSTVGIYAIGEPFLISLPPTILGVPRFTSAPGANPASSGIPTWAVGSTAIGLPLPTCSSQTVGALYADTGASTTGGNNTLYICKSTGWHALTM